VLARLKNLRFQEGRNNFRYSPNVLLRGVLELHVAFDALQPEAKVLARN
jgi:hypothetical protein